MIPLPAGPPHLPPRLCPVPSCGEPAARGHAMCMPCWSLVSKGVQDTEMVAFRAWCRGDLSDDLYHEALWTAVRSSLEGRRPRIIRAQRTGRPGHPFVPRNGEARSA